MNLQQAAIVQARPEIKRLIAGYTYDTAIKILQDSIDGLKHEMYERQV